jgi:hypothetical protein
MKGHQSHLRVSVKTWTSEFNETQFGREPDYVAAKYCEKVKPRPY